MWWVRPDRERERARKREGESEIDLTYSCPLPPFSIPQREQLLASQVFQFIGCAIGVGLTVYILNVRPCSNPACRRTESDKKQREREERECVCLHGLTVYILNVRPCSTGPPPRTHTPSRARARGRVSARLRARGVTRVNGDGSKTLRARPRPSAPCLLDPVLAPRARLCLCGSVSVKECL